MILNSRIKLQTFKLIWQETSWKSRIYPAADEMSVFVAIDLLIVLEHAVTGAGTHKVIVALTRCQAAAHCGTRLVAALTSLRGVGIDGNIQSTK